MALTQADMAAAIAERLGMTKTDTGKVLGALVQEISATLGRGEEVRIFGLGAFRVADRPARKGRNLRTGETIDIPASKAPKFAPAKALKDAVAPPAKTPAKKAAKAAPAKAKKPAKKSA